MLRSVIVAMAMFASLAATGASIASERLKVDLTCEATDEHLVYTCTFAVTGRKSGKAIEGADFSVSADMPSMPMAHNVRPVKPEPGKEPGIYRANLELEMLGEWALKLTFREPVRDLLIEKIEFKDPGPPSNPDRKR